MPSAVQFYDDLAEHYDLIYSDWEASMLRHGRLISAELRSALSNGLPSSVRVLDAAAGVGTQSLPLAALGFDMVARDLSEASIARLSREARARQLTLDAAPGDMLALGQCVSGLFDAVIAFDNAIPHLLDDAQILTALRGFRDLMNPSGLLLLSVRDYANVDRSSNSHHPYGERQRDGRTFRLSQHWQWLDSSHYRALFTIEELLEGHWQEVLSTEATYYAVAVSHLLKLIAESGFVTPRVIDSEFFQPVLSARRAK